MISKFNRPHRPQLWLPDNRESISWKKEGLAENDSKAIIARGLATVEQWPQGSLSSSVIRKENIVTSNENQKGFFCYTFARTLFAKRAT